MAVDRDVVKCRQQDKWEILMPRQKKSRGRPPHPMPTRIDASPEEIARAMFAAPPDRNWRYLEEQQETAPDSGATTVESQHSV